MHKNLEVYIHIPFCVQKCRYCDFLSGPADTDTKERYMEALCREITMKSENYKAYRVVSVFIGGGTPSCVESEWIGKVLDTLRKYYRVAETAEITLEMNPGTVDRKKLLAYYQAGINRLSMGLQSVRKEELEVLGRIHSYEQFVEAYFTAREIGFSNINVDIMSGLPGQSPEDYRVSLQQVTGLTPPPEHISAYSLIIEEGTPFYQAYEEGKLDLPDEDTERGMYELTGSFLADKGYRRYEISNYAVPGKECRHNMGYWLRENYVGFGIGAASLVENVRFRNEEDLEIYIGEPENCCRDIQKLTIREQMEETMFLGLRLTEGVSVSRFEENFGVPLDQIYGSVIEKHKAQGLLEEYELNAERDNEEGQGVQSIGRICRDRRDQYIRLTPKGMDVSNYVMADFLEP